MLKLIDIVKNYKIANDEEVKALKGINIEFKDNEFVSILGPSGCGKTTLLNIIGGLDKYTSGNLIIDGISTEKYKDRDWDSYRNHHIGFIFQSYNLITHLSVLANVELSLTLSGINKKTRREKAIEALKKVGLGDQINKKPNQLSGGQMQRVAIARAIVNDPDIILADEPTGALDSKTSIQIMDLLKEIAKDKLVIMVTHNPELAQKYSTRIVSLMDGNIIDDTKQTELENMEIKHQKTKRTAMSFLTALSISFKNLITKKTRTILTSIAGSIGIIGVALVLSLTNGFERYVEKMQADTLSSYPLEIAETALNTEVAFSESQIFEKFPNLKEVYINKVIERRQNMYTTNNITQEYVDNVIEQIDKNLLIAIKYDRNMQINFFTSNGFMKQESGDDIAYTKVSNSVFQEMLNNNEFIASQYDVLEGTLPTKEDEIIIVVDQYNRLSDSFLTQIGIYKQGDTIDKFEFEDLMNLEFKVLTNDEMYNFNGHDFDTNLETLNGSNVVYEDVYNSGLTLKVVGIVRAKKDTAMGSLNSGIAYSPLLTDYIMDKNKESELVDYLNENVNIDPFTGETYVIAPTSTTTIEAKYNSDLKKYGANTVPNGIKIYPKDFDSKTLIKEYLDNYNSNQEEGDKVVYTDIMEIMVKTINTLIKTVSYILIAFTAISLVVSSIMIAIITYVSVIERTKEIGVLRSIGARKKDISRVFNAETFIIGLSAGVFGVLMTVVLNHPINKILSSLVEGIGNISVLSLFHAFLLIGISVVLTLLSGFIPALMAARKDPVIALRSE